MRRRHLLMVLAFGSPVALARPVEAQSVGHVALMPAAWRPVSDTLPSPLAIIDDFGEPISEAAIKDRMKRAGPHWWLQPLAFLGGAGLAFLAAPKGPNYNFCTKYEPCTPREEFYISTSALAGGIIGVILVNAATPGIDRFGAVEKVREERRIMHRLQGVPADRKTSTSPSIPKEQ